MSKMSQLSAQLDELRHCGEVLVGIADSLRELYSGVDEAEADVSAEVTEESGAGEKAPAEKVPAEKTKGRAKKVSETAPEKKALTLEDVRTVLAEKSRAGFTEQVREIIARHGGKKLSEIDPAEYEAVIAEVEVLKDA